MIVSYCAGIALIPIPAWILMDIWINPHTSNSLFSSVLCALHIIFSIKLQLQDATCRQ